MKLALPLSTLALAAGLCALTPPTASALSVPLSGPSINFPQGQPAPPWAPAVLRALNDPQMHYLGGLISEWPPNWWTILDYNGDSAAFNSLLASLEAVKGLRLACSFARSTAPNAQPGSWRLEYSQATPDKIALIINLRSDKIDLTQIRLPEFVTGQAVFPAPAPNPAPGTAAKTP